MRHYNDNADDYMNIYYNFFYRSCCSDYYLLRKFLFNREKNLMREIGKVGVSIANRSWKCEVHHSWIEVHERRYRDLSRCAPAVSERRVTRAFD